MVAGIDDWLFRFDNDGYWCEPELNDNGKITCVNCSEKTCPYWLDYNCKGEKFTNE